MRNFRTPPARLPRDVPEKAEAFLREALCAASCELRASNIFGDDGLVGRARPAKGFVFSDPSRGGYGGWRVVVYYEFNSTLRIFHNG